MPVPDEIWTTRDGRKIPVSEMAESHVRNVLRMILRSTRILKKKIFNELTADMNEFDWKEMRDAQARRDLANPEVYFPLLEGGTYGSPELQKKYGNSF